MTTCQICARAIKTVKARGLHPVGYPGQEVIAHHGYKRPGHGWQTSSCHGARHLPYEISRDAIPPVIDWLERAILAVDGELAAMMLDPPATLVRYRDGYGVNLHAAKIEVPRPEGFDPEKAIRSCWSPGSYGGLFAASHSDKTRQVKDYRQALAELRQRFFDWKPPAEAA